MWRRLCALILGALAMVAAACGDATSDREAAPTEDTLSTTTLSTTTPSTTTLSTTTAPEPGDAEPGWVTHETGPECMCADGSPYFIHTRTADPQKVLLYFEGGGACFDEATCAFGADATYTFTTRPDGYPGLSGIFDVENPDNPLADYSMVYVPYCTGDVHLGNATRVFDDFTVQHNGATNARHGFDYLVDNFPEATDVFVAGSSAGGIPAPLYGGLVADFLPDASVAVLADASGGYPSNEVFNTIAVALYNSNESWPDWPELERVPPMEVGVPDLFRLAGSHDPDVRMARYDNVADEVQAFFSELISGDAALLEVLYDNEDLVEADGVDLDVYLAPGEDHTILFSNAIYDLEVENVAFLDWLTALVTGEDAGDVRCATCGDPRPEA